MPSIGTCVFWRRTKRIRVYFLAAHLIDQTISMHAFRSERSLTVNLF